MAIKVLEEVFLPRPGIFSQGEFRGSDFFHQFQNKFPRHLRFSPQCFEKKEKKGRLLDNDLSKCSKIKVSQWVASRARRLKSFTSVKIKWISVQIQTKMKKEVSWRGKMPPTLTLSSLGQPAFDGYLRWTWWIFPSNINFNDQRNGSRLKKKVNLDRSGARSKGGRSPLPDSIQWQLNTERSFAITRIFEAKDFGHNDDEEHDFVDGCGDVLIVIDALIGDRLCGQLHEYRVVIHQLGRHCQQL